MQRMHRMVSALACVAGLAGQGAHAQPAYAAPLRLDGAGPYYSLDVTPVMAAQARSSSGALSLRVVNARGEPVPFAWRVAHDRLLPVQRSVSLPMLRSAVPLEEQALAASEPAKARWPVWIMDARALSGRVTRLQLQWPSAAQGIFALAVEASSDAQHWRSVIAHAQVMDLRQDAHTLRLDTIDLDVDAPGWLRVRLLSDDGVEPGFTAALATVQSNTTISADNWVWSEPITAQQCTPTACDFALPEALEAERLRIVWAEPNHLADLQLLALVPATPVGDDIDADRYESRHHGLRRRLHELHEGTRSAVAARPGAPTWQELATGRSYWIRTAQGDLRSPDWEGAFGAHRQLRLAVAPASGMSLAGLAGIQVGSRVQSLVFLAQGPGPYRAEWGGAMAQAPRMSLEQLVAPTDSGGPVEIAVAHLEAVTSVQPPAPASPAAPAGRQPWLLWAGLGLGVAVMGAMAWALLREPKEK